MSLRISTVVVTAFAQNCRIIEAGNKAAVLDPGGDCDLILRALAAKKLECREIWITHSHVDHVGAVQRLKSTTNATVLGHPAGAEFRRRAREIAEMYGLGDSDTENCPEPDRMIEGGETLSFEGFDFEVRFTPGHAPDHVIFVNHASKTVLAGDTLFAGSIGRTDLPGGNHGALIESIERQILTLPDDYIVMPGHGPDTTVGHERKTNQFLL